jgi:prolyl oligopeptidase
MVLVITLKHTNQPKKEYKFQEFKREINFIFVSRFTLKIMLKNKIKQILLFLVFLSQNSIYSQLIKLPKKPVSETHFGKTIVDDYRYMENNSDTLVQKWYKQNSIESENLLKTISGKNEIVNKLIEFEKRRSFSVTLVNITESSTYFYLKTKEEDKVGKLYCKKDNIETLLFDPKDYKNIPDSNYIINYIKPSWNGKIIALGFSKNGEEVGEIAFFDLASKKLLPQIINNCWPAEFDIDWLPDNSGIMYLHIPVIDTNDANYILNTELVIYKLGDNPTTHKVILSQKNNPELKISSADFPIPVKYNDLDNYIIAYLAGAEHYSDYYYAKVNELNNEKINWKPLCKREDKLVYPILKDESIYFLSSKNTPNFKIIKTQLANLNFEKAEIVVPENKNEAINEYELIKDNIVYTTTKNGVEANLFIKNDKNAEAKKIKLPVKAGSLALQIKNKQSNELWFTANGWLTAKKRFFCNVNTNSITLDDLSPNVLYPEFKDFVVDEIEIPSHDGVLVPVSMIYQKNIKKNKQNNVFLYGYGSYSISQAPRFQPIFLSWVLQDGIFVVPHVRGGGEKGDDWHNQGYKATKPNTWKDMVATAEYLIKEKITNPTKIAISSASAGGIMVGRAITERPDLFKVMLCNAGELNPLRIKETPNGPNNMKELGNPDIEEEFNALYEMDAYHHIEKGVKYPACLISVGMNDARVAPWMSGKFVAKLRECTASKNPIVFKVDYDSGHGMDSSNFQLYNNFADRYAFALWQMGHPKFQLKK